MYDKQTDYKQLLKIFLENHDPTSLNKQGGDAGTQYRSGLYFHTEEQRQIAEEVMAGKSPAGIAEVVLLAYLAWYQSGLTHNSMSAKGPCKQSS